eukprot:TRINITY_DN9987_c1_g1_i1.p1 TRINITY_DN9987_c1_g1~~TRINITY_DN9987_c1_g1_i1.p1  ORF type:complete len:547 (-),score=152.35 TRINITY_DN9987_c1_g1_i1:164-1804(-)
MQAFAVPPGPPPGAPPAAGFEAPAGDAADEDEYACEYCNTNYKSFKEAEDCEARCQAKQGGAPPPPHLPEQQLQLQQQPPINGLQLTSPAAAPPAAAPGLPGVQQATPELLAAIAAAGGKGLPPGGLQPGLAAFPVGFQPGMPAVPGMQLIPGLPGGKGPTDPNVLAAILAATGKGGMPAGAPPMLAPPAAHQMPLPPMPPELAMVIARGVPGVPPEVLAPKGPLLGKGIAILAARGVAMPGLNGGKGGPAVPGKAPEMPGTSPRTGTSVPSVPLPASDPILKAVGEFIVRWELEKRFEPKIISYIKAQSDKSFEEVLKNLERSLTEAGVPPVCRSGYLLVVFGEVSEKSTDDDFRYLLTGKTSERDEDERERDEDELPRGGRGAKAAASGDKDGGKGGGVSAAPLSDSWMQEEIDNACSKYKLDAKVKSRWMNAMRNRRGTFKEDMNTLNDVLRAAKHPKGQLALKLREIERGTFTARSYSPLGPTPAEREDMERAKKDKDKGDKKESDRGGSRDRKSRSRDRKSRSRDRRRKGSRSRSRRRDRD